MTRVFDIPGCVVILLTVASEGEAGAVRGKKDKRHKTAKSSP
jgi:hypothetical protein